MDEFLKMDVFFVATTAVVVLGGLVGLIALFYVIRILRNVDHVTQNVSLESDAMRSDLTELRSKIKQEGMKMKHFADFFSKMNHRRKSRKK